MNNAINFLLYSYFKETLDSDYHRIMEKIISKAYFDATQQGAYNTLIPDMLREKSNEAFLEGKSKIKTEIERFFRGICVGVKVDKKENYDSWHKDICRNLIDIYENRLGDTCYFSCGNAQKWINMTMKYLYLLAVIFSEVKGSECEFCNICGNGICFYAEVLHVPVDSYIIEAVWKMENNELPIKDEKRLKDGSIGKYSGEKVLAWSKWEDYFKYMKFQDFMREVARKEGKNAIEWECSAWLEIAEKRNA